LGASCSTDPSSDSPRGLDAEADQGVPSSEAPQELVTLTVSGLTVTRAGDLVLRATVQGAAPSTVTFLDGGRPIGSDDTAPFERVLALTAADNGAHAFAAKATFPNGGAISAPVTVVVDVPDDSVYVDPARGADGNPGTKTAPLKNIAKAAQMVKPGQTIVLADGSYDLETQSTLDIAFSVPAVLRGSSPAGAVLKGNGTTTGFAFARGGEVRDIAFEDFGAAFTVAGGTFAASGVRFANVSLPFYFRGDSRATVDLTGMSQVLTKVAASGLGFALVVVEDSAQVSWKGGVLANSAVNGALVRGAGRLSVEGLTIKDLRGTAFVLLDHGQLALNRVVIQRAGLGSAAPDKAVIAMGGPRAQAPLGATLTLDGTEISQGTGPAIVLSLPGRVASRATIELNDSHIDGNLGTGLWVTSPGNLSPALTVTIAAAGTTFRGNEGGGVIAARASMTITGGEVSNNLADGIAFDDDASVNALTVRGTRFAGNMGDAISFAGTAASTLDLGQPGAAGRLEFAGVPAGGSAVRVDAPIVGQAVGNSWLTAQQGADAEGRYTTTMTFMGPVTGPNVTLAAGAALVVAE
jgi:hypothetical protein